MNKMLAENEKLKYQVDEAMMETIELKSACVVYQDWLKEAVDALRQIRDGIASNHDPASNDAFLIAHSIVSKHKEKPRD